MDRRHVQSKIRRKATATSAAEPTPQEVYAFLKHMEKPRAQKGKKPQEGRGQGAIRVSEEQMQDYLRRTEQGGELPPPPADAPA